jgi:TRAP-type mannitol/chloroaromatic compound transport system substrate-binding protein
MMANYDHKNPAALRQLVANGAQLRPFSREVLSACFDAASATYAGINAVNPAFKKIYEDQAEFRKESFLWLQLSEYTFDTFMMVQQRSGKL